MLLFLKPRLPVADGVELHALVAPDEATPVVKVDSPAMPTPVISIDAAGPSAPPGAPGAMVRLMAVTDAEMAKSGRSVCLHCKYCIPVDNVRFYYCYHRSLPSRWIHPTCLDDVLVQDTPSKTVHRERLSNSIRALKHVLATKVPHSFGMCMAESLRDNCTEAVGRMQITLDSLD